MAKGPGKYDDLTTYVYEQAEALVAITIVIGGNKGSGFSVQAPPRWQEKLPAILRMVAFEMEQEARESKGKPA